MENMNLMARGGQPHPKKEELDPAFTQDMGASKKQLTVKLDEELHRKLKTYASQNGTTITEMISAYIREL